MINWLKKISVFLIPVFIMLITYITLDPFRIIGSLEESKVGPVASSDDYYGVERFLLNVQENHTYNTFVFGNSKTLAFTPDAFCKSTECSYFNFGAPGESIRNIHDKLNLILEEGQELKKVLIVLDHKVLMNENNTHPDFIGPVYEHHPSVSEKFWIEFHLSFLKFFIRDFFFYDLLKWKLTGKWHPSFKGKISEVNPSESVVYNNIQNFSIRTKAERQIEQQPDLYYSRIKTEMKKLEPVTHELKLSTRQVNLMKEMKLIFLEHNTEFNIIFGPYWNSDQLDRSTISMISECFGADHVYDFSGGNHWNTDVHNWYESSHYRPTVGASILKSIQEEGYSNQSK